MKNNFTKEVLVSLALIVLTVTLLNPFHFWMPEVVVVAILAVTFIVFALFSIFILREKAQDEREMAHRMLSGRVAFLVGSSILIVGIIIQSLNHSVDAWLVVTLVAMILSKIAARVYGDSRL
jgi:hypothetical protein